MKTVNMHHMNQSCQCMQRHLLKPWCLPSAGVAGGWYYRLAVVCRTVVMTGYRCVAFKCCFSCCSKAGKGWVACAGLQAGVSLLLRHSVPCEASPAAMHVQAVRCGCTCWLHVAVKLFAVLSPMHTALALSTTHPCHSNQQALRQAACGGAIKVVWLCVIVPTNMHSWQQSLWTSHMRAAAWCAGAHAMNGGQLAAMHMRGCPACKVCVCVEQCLRMNRHWYLHQLPRAFVHHVGAMQHCEHASWQLIY
jgi:hypothetical protein